MTHEEFITLVKCPETVRAEQVIELKEIVELYPYLASAHLFLSKALQKSNSIHYGGNLNKTALYCSNRQWFYYYLYPEKMLSNEPYRRDRIRKSSGDYFDMINVVESEGGDTKQSLKNLAERLKSARAMVVGVSEEPTLKINVETNINQRQIIDTFTDKGSVRTVSVDYFSPEVKDISESGAKKLIMERKYTDAIEILRRLNLNNPKKSVYFADQIRFLEIIIANSKK